MGEIANRDRDLAIEERSEEEEEKKEESAGQLRKIAASGSRKLTRLSDCDCVADQYDLA